MRGKEIYTGLYSFGDMECNSFCGGISARIKLPEYSSKITFFINDEKIDHFELIEGVEKYDFSLTLRARPVWSLNNSPL